MNHDGTEAVPGDEVAPAGEPAGCGRRIVETLAIALAMSIVLATLAYWNSESIGRWLTRRGLHELVEKLDRPAVDARRYRALIEEIDAFVDEMPRRVSAREYGRLNGLLLEVARDGRLDPAEVEQLIATMRAARGL